MAARTLREIEALKKKVADRDELEKKYLQEKVWFAPRTTARTLPLPY
jgi:hypothetical protein